MDQLFSHLFPDDQEHVDLLSAAFSRFTPATLLNMNQKGLTNFLEEMTSELAILNVRYNA